MKVVAVVVLPLVLLVWAGAPEAHAAVPSTMPSTSQPAQLPWNSLQNEMFKSVELVQDAIRSPKAQAAKRTPTSMQYKTTLQKQNAAPTSQPNVAAQVAHQLIGKVGLISFRVEDIHDNRHPPLFILAPQAVGANARKSDFLVIGTCENPTPTYLSPQARVAAQLQEKHGVRGAIEHQRQSAESAKPRHKLWIFTDDPSVRDWVKQSRHLINVEVLDATLTPGNGDYVRAELVVRTKSPPTTAPAETQSPAG